MSVCHEIKAEKQITFVMFSKRLALEHITVYTVLMKFCFSVISWKGDREQTATVVMSNFKMHAPHRFTWSNVCGKLLIMFFHAKRKLQFVFHVRW